VRRVLATTLAALVLASVTGCFAARPIPAEDGEQRLRIALPRAPARQLSPFTDDAWRGAQLGATETLLTLDRLGEVVPGLARSWSQVDATTVRLRLREQVAFHDGTRLTPSHAAAAIAHAAAARPVLRALDGVHLTATAVGDDVLELRTATPDPVLLRRLTSPQLAILAPRAYARDPRSPDPVGAGTGPYRIASVQGTSGMTLERHPGYWGGRPALAGLDVRFLPDGPARVGALRTGEVDLISEVPAAQAPNLGDARLIEVPLPRTVSLYLIGTAGRPFADPALRAAARGVVDPVMIANSVYEGMVDPATGLFGPASPWAARRPAAGTPPAVTAAAPSGAPAGTRITLATYPRRPELPEIASALAAALTAEGFVVETVVREYTTIEPDVLAGRFDAFLLSRSYVHDTGDPIAYFTSDFTCRGTYNIARFCDPAFDARVDAAAAQGDLTARHAAARVLAAELLERAVVVPLVHERARFAAATAVTDLASDPYERTLITALTSLG
jgi:peptide/nickel transport system substrate-binding protein